MRRIALFLTAALTGLVMVLVSTGSASAQYPPPALPPSPTPTETASPSETPTEEPTATETPTEEPTATETPTEEPTTEPTGTEEPSEEPTVPPAPGTPDDLSCAVVAGTINCTVPGLLPGSAGTVTATCNGQTVTQEGVVNEAGVLGVSIPAPEGCDEDSPFDVAVLGVSITGDPAVGAGSFGDTDPAETPATGTDSSTLALIAAGALIAGAGALILARRRTMTTIG